MPPTLQISNIRQVFNDGNHNAFTDLCRFGDYIYLTFRSCPDGHMLFTSSRIVVMRSEDGVDWAQVHEFSVPKRDVRDPHFAVLKDRIFVYTGTWWVEPGDSSERDINDHLGYCASSEDGVTWQGPTLLNGTHGHYIWRAGTHDGVAYLNGRRLRNFDVIEDREEAFEAMESWLMASEDGVNWTPLGLMQPAYGDETAFVFEDDGSVLAVARTMGRRPAQVCRAAPPYTSWTQTDLDRYVGGPMLARWGDRYLVGGRKMSEGAPPVTTIYWLVDDQLQEIAELPSGGDNSYPGFVALSSQKGLLSFYSSHEGSGTSLAPSAIYLADLEVIGDW
ncbi:MAG: sialidase family protein [Caldilineaceae bacterium]